MPNTKKKTGPSSVTLMIVSCVFLFLAVIMMFFPNIICHSLPRDVYAAFRIFFNNQAQAGFKGAWPVFVGYMLLLACAILTLFMALPFWQYDYKTERILFITLTVCELVGAALIGLINVWLFAMNDIPLEQMIMHVGPYAVMALSVVCAAFNIWCIQLDK